MNTTPQNTTTKNVIVEDKPCKYNNSTIEEVIDELLMFNWYPSLLLNVKTNRLRARTTIAWRFERVATYMLRIQDDIDLNCLKCESKRFKINIQYKQIKTILSEHTKYMNRLKPNVLTAPEIDEINEMHSTLKAMHGKLSKQGN